MDTLRELRGGVLHDDLSDALQEVVGAVTQEGKAGKLTLTITVKPAGADRSGALLVTDDIKVTVPKPTIGSTVLYATPENNLQRQDPRQRALDLRGLPDPEPLRDPAIPAGIARA